MKVVYQQRTYEERDGEWVVHSAPARASGFFPRAMQLASTGLVLAALAIMGIAAMVVGLLLLPVAVLASWLRHDGR
jgi:hypothetical protein